MNKTKIVNRIVTVIGLSLGAFALSALAGTWTAPTLPPPNGNVDAPVNVGSSAQAKDGALGLGKSLPIISGLKLDVSGVIGATGALISGDTSITGNVGIGTVAPSKKLEVVGGPIKATGGLIIETVAADPASPESGRMWLVTP